MKKCLICGEEKEDFQMKDKEICNICSFEKSKREDYKKTLNKFENAKKIK